jgi:hypothetical protein
MSTQMPNDDRSRAGYSDRSYLKHQELKYLLRAQANAYWVHHREARILLIDTNAGDGRGVRKAQMSIRFDGDEGEGEFSEPTALVQARLHGEIGAAGLMACEKNPERRLSLRREILSLVPSAIILDDNQRLLNVDFNPYDYALVVCDPCGYSERELHWEVLQHIASRPRLRSDFIFTHNRSAWGRLMGMSDESKPFEPQAVRAVRQSKAKYVWQMDLEQWAARLNRNGAARTRIAIRQSGNYSPQFIVVANHFGDCISRNRQRWEIYNG